MKSLVLCCAFLIGFSLQAQNVDPNDFTVFITSDPQFPWACPSSHKTSDGKKAPKCEDRQRAAADNLAQVHWILKRMRELKSTK